ncbi:MAG: RtcB family protein, partial [Halobacteria archaeon]|nr:RtcB family protein [Halobacteria archaeon]
KTLEQVRNVATLPGLQKYSIVMPDGHQGYGFPIGGVAAVDAEDGVISPGGIGYDINCLTGDSDVLLEFGRRRKIESLVDGFADEKAVVAAENQVESDIRLATESENKQVYEVETATGDRIRATKDHEFLTPDGMKPLKEIEEGSSVYLHPFDGIEGEGQEPEEFTVLDEDDFGDEDPQLVKVLKERDLLPLESTDREFNILLKLVGFHTGDGSFNNHGETTFYAEKEDLKTIQDDIRELGFKPSKIYSRDRTHGIDGKEFETTEHSVKSTSNAFQQLLVRLGAPKGKKVEHGFTTPEYMDRLAGWQKALYLSAFFGAEMSGPAPQTDTVLYAPTVSHNRAPEKRDAGQEFMREI